MDTATRQRMRHVEAATRGRSRPALPAPSSRAGAHRESPDGSVNVADTERLASLAAGIALAGYGLSKRGGAGILLAVAGGLLAYRGASGHCQVYEALGVDTSIKDQAARLNQRGIHVTESFLVSKSPEEIYLYWRDFEGLPTVMPHLKSVRVREDGRSEWTASAPDVVGGEVHWEAEITTDRPNEQIAWRTLPGGWVDHRGSVTITPALGDRGTNVRVDLDYLPPAGRVGHWITTLFGEYPDSQIRSALRNFKRMMETGETPTTTGQPKGSCGGLALR